MKSVMTRMAALAMPALVLGLSRSGSAAELLLDARLPEGAVPVEVRFEAQRDRGAWVVVEFRVDDPIAEGVGRVEEQKVDVSGLTYDAARHAVVLKDAAGGDVVCAVRERGLLATAFRQTPECRLRLRNEEHAANGAGV